MLFDVSGSLRLAACVFVVAVVYFVAKLVSRRRFHHKLPGPPHSLLWGHLKLMGSYMQKLPPAGYIHTAITQVKHDYNLPDIFYLDLWPFGPFLLLLTSPDAAAIPTTISNFPMPQVVTESFEGNVGTTFIEATNGPLWKSLMEQLAPGLTATNVKTHHRSIVNNAKALYDALDRYAEAGQVVNMHLELGRYPFQVLASLFFGGSLSEQAYKDTMRMVDLMLMKNINSVFPNPLANWPWRNEMNRCLGRLEGEIEARVCARYAFLQEHPDEAATGKGSTLLDRMLVARMHNRQHLDRSDKKVIIENANGFIVAGYGTTTDTTTYIWVLLSTFPEVLRKLRIEHDRAFGKDFNTTVQMLQENPSLLNNLGYTTAVIHETLRLFPIGMTARQTPSDMTMLEYKGQNYPVRQNHLLGIMTHSIHYDPNIFDEPKRFWPERFLDTTQPVPRNAHRPFERGVRACIGQALAMDEMRISLVMTARWLDFELVNHLLVGKPLFAHTDLDTKRKCSTDQVIKVAPAVQEQFSMSSDTMDVKPTSGYLYAHINTHTHVNF